MRRTILAIALFWSVFDTTWLVSQSQPAVEPASNPAQTAAQHLLQWRRSRVTLADDWGELERYRADNARLAALPADGERVVFFGDSITDGWNLEQYFPGKPYINRGISGQTTPQMLVRFRQDVIELHPRAVVILAGTNDIAGNTGSMRNEDIAANLASMADLAKANNIQVIFASVTPVNNFTPSSQDFFYTRPQERILALNKWLKAYCAANNITYLDYFSAMVDTSGMLKRELADDGLHPNATGYRIMSNLVNDALKGVVAQKSEEKPGAQN